MTPATPTRAIRLVPADAERYARLRLHMLNEAPWAYMASPEDDRALDLAHLRAMLAEDESAAFAVPAADGDELVAVSCVARVKSPKFRHRAKVWGVFCDPAERGRGLGRAVVGACLTLARSWDGVEWIDLGVSANSPAAQRLYESLGFVEWGREPESTRIGDRRWDEIMMALRVGSRPRA